MRLGGIELRCPRCRGELQPPGAAPDELRCDGCGTTYPVVLGIPDLRIFPDPYIDLAADRAKGRHLAERFADFDFRGLVDFYYRITPAVTPAQARQFTRGLLAGVPRAEAALAQWEAAGASDSGPASALLEVGCGTGPLLVAAAPRWRTLVGVDISFRWLVVGKKRLAEAGLDIPLVCACAEGLPLEDAAFDRVVADSAIEHFRDPDRALTEMHRVLRSGGRLLVSTPNRFSLGPDPHVGLWASWLIPRRWIDAYVRRQGGVPPQRRLLSVWSLRRLLGRSGFETLQVFLPGFAAGQRAHFQPLLRLLVGLYDALRRLPGSRHLLFLFGPLLYAVGEKGERSLPPRDSRS